MISKTGLAFAATYVIAAIYLIYDDRYTQAGGWINLHGMTSAIATLPAWAVCEMLGSKPNYQSNLQMSALVAACAGLAYWIGVGVRKVFTKIVG